MHDLVPHFTAWRTLQVGTREVIEGILSPEARGPSPELRAALARWQGAWYWADAARSRVTLIRPLAVRRPPWILHLGLFGLTLLSALGAGAVLVGGWSPQGSQGGLASAVSGAGLYFYNVLTGDWRHLLQGWSFALPLLAILLVHELGHYLAARRYALDATPPFFLPVPPTLSPIGSLGAFIRLRSVVLDRRQLLEVGSAGPLAGFVVALLVLVWGYGVSERIPIVLGADPSYVTLAGQPVFLGESLLTRSLRNWLLPGTAAVHLSAPAFAGWVGIFVTGLNLLPLSQLDGGHILYGLLGRRQAAVGLAAIAALLYLAQRTPTWYVWVAIALLVGGGRWGHPPVLMPERALPPPRRWVGWASVAVFVATFMPFPFGGG
jgi:hypothetical protein